MLREVARLVEWEAKNARGWKWLREGHTWPRKNHAGDMTARKPRKRHNRVTTAWASNQRAKTARKPWERDERAKMKQTACQSKCLVNKEVLLSVLVLQELNASFPVVFSCHRYIVLLLFFRWWGYKVLQRIPNEDHDEVMLKAAAFDCLGGKRKNWALKTRWRGNYLAKVNQ